MPGPLSGVRVLDFGRAAVGPVSAQYLGFLGADVVKIEPPEGDPVRNVATFKRGMGTTFLGNNLNKRGIMLDLKKPDDMAVARRLIQWTDIVLENFRSGEVDGTAGPRLHGDGRAESTGDLPQLWCLRECGANARHDQQ